MTDLTPLPVDVEGTVELAQAPPSWVQLIAVVGLVAGLLVCLVIVGLGLWLDRETPAVLDVTLGALAGSLGTLLVGNRR